MRANLFPYGKGGNLLLDFNTDKLINTLRERVGDFNAGASIYSSGKVSRVADGVVKVDNLPGRCSGELLQFGEESWGIALDLEENGVGAVLLTQSGNVSVGDTVSGTGHPVDVPVSEEVIGRILSPIGVPLDGNSFSAKKYAPMEKPAPSIISRRPVDTPLETGILAIDSMIPIGRGQRELIIGDRQTGKTTIAVDTIINQKGKGVICVYCAIGQKASTVAKVAHDLTAAGAMDYTTIIVATASDMPAMQYLAPYAACSIAEEFMSQGKDVLVVYDDLSKHAVAYRTISLLLHRPPGREAYPGDVFYLHSRLLERSACLSHANGGGSITALPIIETVGGNISAYIPTNVISITDGQLYLETELFNSGIRPAVNTGLSVSRVGRAAQYKAMQKVSGLIRIELAQYKEMAVFARFGSDADSVTKRILERGECLMTLLKQPAGSPYSLSEEVILLLAYRENIFDGIPADSMIAAREEIMEYVKDNAGGLLSQIAKTGDMTSDTEDELASVLEKWKKSKHWL